MLFKWNDSYSLNIPSIDDQHKYLVGALNKVHEIAVDERSMDDIADVFNDLMLYMKKHFAYEEELFEMYNYPGKDNHANLHREITEKVHAFYKDFTIQKHVDITDFFSFMVEWLQQHILKEDKGYSLFLISKGVM